MSNVLHQNIDQAFERELAVLLRRRFLWLCATWIVLTVVVYLWKIARPVFGFVVGSDFLVDVPALSQIWMLAFGEMGRLLILALSVWTAYRECKTRRGILRVAYWTIVSIGLLSILVRIDPLHPIPQGFRVTFGPSTTVVDQFISPSAGSIALAHFFMCLFLPWTPKQAMKPLVILAPLWILAALTYDGFSERFITSGLIGAPLLTGAGLLICWGRHSHIWERVESKVLRRQFQETQRELVDARRIHEARFPSPIRSGPARLEFDYEPMRQIGGDFLHAHSDDAGTLHVALIDVTGHGVAAALAINRIDGELARLVAEHPDDSPGKVLSDLNRYIQLTMAKHSLYATAFCFSISQDGELQWANGGHPPAFVRDANGKVKLLESTTFMLGACPERAFDPGMQRTILAPADTIIVYTDGACEAFDHRGRQFGVRGLQQTIERWRPDRGIPLIPFLPATVRNYRYGAPLDDVLFAVASYVGDSSHGAPRQNNTARRNMTETVNAE